MIHKTLADSMRPIGLDDVIGQKHLVGDNKLLRQFVKKDHPMSIILYGHLDAEKQLWLRPSLMI